MTIGIEHIGQDFFFVCLETGEKVDNILVGPSDGTRQLPTGGWEYKLTIRLQGTDMAQYRQALSLQDLHRMATTGVPE